MGKAGTIAHLADKVGQLIMSGIDGTEVNDDAEFLFDELRIGNIILMGRNVESPAQVLALTQDLQTHATETLGVPLLIATDQEGGRVQRLDGAEGFLRIPSPRTIGTSTDPTLVRQFAHAAGLEIRAVGIDATFAPALDIDDEPANPVISALRRSFGATPEAVARTAFPFLSGLRDAEVLTGGKHFPGHGSTTADSHFALPIVPKDRAELDRNELRPFVEAIAFGIEMIVTAHVRYPSLDPSGQPATLSAPILTDLLRQELGFTGLIVTDGMEMAGITDHLDIGEAAVHAVLAGADLVLCVRQRPASKNGRATITRIRDALLEAAKTGRLSEERINDSVERIRRLKDSRVAYRMVRPDLSIVGCEEHQRLLANLLETVDGDEAEADLSEPSLLDRVTCLAETALRDLGDRVVPSRGPLD